MTDGNMIPAATGTAGNSQTEPQLHVTATDATAVAPPQPPPALYLSGQPNYGFVFNGSMSMPYGSTELQPGDPGYNKTWHLTKLILLATSVVASIVAIVLAIAMRSLGRGYVPGRRYYYWVDQVTSINFGLGLSVASVALLWDLAQVLTLWRARGLHRRGIHPGAHVGMHLVIWLGAAIALVIMRLLIGEWNDWFVDENHLPGLHTALSAFVGILAVSHFVLFVFACVDTHRLRRLRRTAVFHPLPVPLGQANAYPVYAYPTNVYPVVQPGKGPPAQNGSQHAAAGSAHPASHTDSQSVDYGYYAPDPGQQSVPGKAVPERNPGPPAPVSPL